MYSAIFILGETTEKSTRDIMFCLPFMLEGHVCFLTFFRPIYMYRKQEKNAKT